MPARSQSTKPVALAPSNMTFGRHGSPWVSARLSYTYRSEFFVTFDRTTPLNEDSLSSVDASVVFNVMENLALTFDGINLTDEKLEQFAGTKDQPRAIYDNGRTYYAGVRVKF